MGTGSRGADALCGSRGSGADWSIFSSLRVKRVRGVQCYSAALILNSNNKEMNKKEDMRVSEVCLVSPVAPKGIRGASDFLSSSILEN